LKIIGARDTESLARRKIKMTKKQKEKREDRHRNLVYAIKEKIDNTFNHKTEGTDDERILWTMAHLFADLIEQNNLKIKLD
jgi:hypothetical protein